MDHIVTPDSQVKDIEELLNGSKSMIIYGTDEKSQPYGVICEGDIVYFTDITDNTLIRAKGVVASVYNSYRLSEAESFELIIRNQDRLKLPDDVFYRWAGKRYIVLVGLRCVKEVEPFYVIRSVACGDREWKTVGRIEDSICPDRVELQYD